MIVQNRVRYAEMMMGICESGGNTKELMIGATKSVAIAKAMMGGNLSLFQIFLFLLIAECVDGA